MLDSNRTAQFYVAWEKVYSHVRSHLDEISLLNGLVNVSDAKKRREHLAEVIEKYPKTKQVLPLIIATRDQKLDVLKIGEDGKVGYLKIDFSESSTEAVLKFCDESGIIELLGQVKDLHSYITGVEVGLDSNARKNRSGTIFEDLVMAALKKKGVDVRKAKEKFELGRSKKPDLMIYKDGKLHAIIEVNFFNEVGSKPLETIQSYITLQHNATEKGIKFILVTDGPAWKSGKVEREKAFDQIDYPLNFMLAVKLVPKMVGK